MGSQEASDTAHFSLVPLLNALLHTGSVTLAARKLGITQSAASQGLARLRTQMQDPLLVPIGGRMQLTPYAVAIASRLDMLVTELDSLLFSSSFDPAMSTRSFTVATSDYLAHLLAIPMLKIIQADAPGIQMQLVEIGVDLTNRMVAREIDFALLPYIAIRDFTTAPLRYRTLLKDPPAVLMDKLHPLASQTTVSSEDIAAYKQVVFRVEALHRTAPHKMQSDPKINPFACPAEQIFVQTDLVSAIPGILEGTQLVAVMTYRLASELSKRWETVTRRLSFGPDSVDFGLAWSPVFDADPAHLWLRTKITAESFTA